MNIVRKLYTSYLASKRDAFVFNSLSCEEGQGGRLGGGLRWGLYYYRECFSPRILPVCVCLWLTVIVVMYLHPGSNICICELPFKGTEHLQCVCVWREHTHFTPKFEQLWLFHMWSVSVFFSTLFSLVWSRWGSVSKLLSVDQSIYSNIWIQLWCQLSGCLLILSTLIQTHKPRRKEAG